MIRTSLCVLTLSFAALSHGAEPVIDNDRVTVWDTTSALPPARHDFVAVPLSQKGSARFGHQGDIPSQHGVRTVVVELKDNSLPPISNSTGYPLAFPRPHVKKLLENERVIVWDYEWRPGESTPMHFHDKDTVAVFESNGAVQSTLRMVRPPPLTLNLRMSALVAATGPIAKCCSADRHKRSSLN